MVDTTREKRVLSLCLEAQAFPADEQTAFLTKAAGDDLELLKDVQRLLALVGKQDDFLEDSASVLGSYLDESSLVGTEIGGFLIQELVGRGGMGSVFRAERSRADFQQTVAVKIMDARLLTPHLRTRFHDERKILANLHHPFIASLIDGGTTTEGVPYLVMEFVEGLPVDQYCKNHQLSLNDRLALLEKITIAVQAAHTNLVVHRDLKPSNILVTADGNPKLLDFGIAKLIDTNRSLNEDSTVTLQGQVTLTPNFASPEQLAQSVITTRSDIYSLGLLAFVLLAGERPYNLNSVPVAELHSAVLKHSTRLPSTVFRTSDRKDEIAADRQVTSKHLHRWLVGELDTIITMATHFDPDRRYATAADMGADLQNFRRGLPLSARGDSTTYRLKKFVSRHRGATAALGLALAATITGISVSLWQAQIAKERFDDVQDLAGALMGEIYESVELLPGSTPARVLMTRETQRYLDRLAKTAGGDQALSFDLAIAYERMGDVLGLPSNANLGDTSGAQSNYNQALEILSELDSNDPQIARAKGHVLQKQVDLFAWQNEMSQAQEIMDKANAIFQAQLEQSPDDQDILFEVARNHIKRGDVLGHPNFPNMGDKDRALREYQQSLTFLKKLAMGANPTWRTRRYLALANERMGTMHVVLNNLDSGLAFYTSSKITREALVTEQPQNYNARRDLGIAIEKIADVRLAQNQSMEAMLQYQEALQIYDALLRLDKENTNAQRTVAVGLENLAAAEQASGELEAAKEHLGRALELWQDLLSLDPSNENVQADLQRVQSAYNSVNNGF